MNPVMTWTQLITALAALLVFYYAVILLVYYRKDLPFLMRTIKQPVAGTTGFSRTATAHVRKMDDVKEDSSYAAVHELLEELKPVFEAAVTQSLVKEQVLEALQIRMRNYPAIKGTGFQTAVNNHIEQELQARSGMMLLEHELETLWQ